MKIHYSTPAWHGGFQKFFANALRSLGHEVFYFNDFGTKSQKLFQRIFTRIPYKQHEFDDKFRGMVSRDWLRSLRAFKPDLIILEHAPNILPSAIREVKREGYKMFYWLDSAATTGQAKDLLAGMLLADKVFSIDRSAPWMTTLFPPDTFHFLPLAGEPSVFRPLPNTKKEYDVVFVGSFPPQSGDGVTRAEIISRIPDKYRVAAFGNGADYWLQFYTKLKGRVFHGRSLPDTEVNEIYNKARIVLSIHSSGHYESVSARTHEAALAGAFQIVDRRHDLAELYPGDMLPSYQWAREINGLLDHWITRPEEREKVAARAREHALAHHTWKHRAEELLRHFQK